MMELLNQLDGFESSKNIKVIMATNRIDVLDPALLRPGRIDRKIEFPPPDVKTRLDILKIHSRKMKIVGDVDLQIIAEKLPETSGAEVKVSLECSSQFITVHPILGRVHRGGDVRAARGPIAGDARGLRAGGRQGAQGVQGELASDLLLSAQGSRQRADETPIPV